ncbi:GNAT family N-acetyltransferase [bacterium]|nr:GNAT family N-acetyltransferase [bacterium]
MMSIRPLKANDLAALALLHQQVHPGFFLTRMGRPFLVAYYSVILKEGGILLGLEEEGRLVGMAAGFLHPAAFYGSLRKSRVKFAWLSFLALLKSPSLLPAIFENSRSVREDGRRRRNGTAQVCELAAIGVHPDFRGGARGRQLGEAFIAEARARGAKQLRASTDAHENDAARAYHAGLGFLEGEEYEVGGGRRMIALEKEL